MTQREFESLVNEFYGVEVDLGLTSDEFNLINKGYMDSDRSKREFVHDWVRFGSARHLLKYRRGEIKDASWWSWYFEDESA
jgi:hypothetical protein